MFGYELADILLFDLETLKESYAGYLSDYRLVFYLGVALNLFLFYFIKRNLRVAYVLLAFCWMFPGYFFFVREFAPIFWPSIYFGYLAIAMGVLLLFCAWMSRSPRPGSQNTPIQNKPLQQLPTGVIQISFGAVTLLPALVSYIFTPDSVMALGTSVTIAALATLSLFAFQKNGIARTVCMVSIIWCLTVCAVLWALVYRV